MNMTVSAVVAVLFLATLDVAIAQELVWRYETGSSVTSSPTLSPDGATLYIGSNDNYVYAIDTSTGELVWRYETRDRVWSSPTLSPDGATLYVGSSDKYVYAIDTSTGKLVWRGQFRTNFSPTLSPDGTTLYIGSVKIHRDGSYDSYVCAIGTRTGTLVWQYETRDRVYSSPTPSPDGATLYVASANYVYAINLSTVRGGGRTHHDLVWQYKAGSHVRYDFGGQLTFSSPTLSPDGTTLYVRSSGETGDTGYIYAITTRTGNMVWRSEIGKSSGSPTLSPDGATLYIGSGGINCKDTVDLYQVRTTVRGCSVYAIGTSTGELVWWYKIGESMSSITPALSPDGATLYIGSHGYYVYGIGTRTGKLVWRYKAGRYASSPILSPDGATLYIGTDDDYIYAIDKSRADCFNAGLRNYATNTCTCDGNPETGLGPRCEFTNAKNCNNAGVVDAAGACTCNDPETGIGTYCEFNNTNTCNGVGIVNATGACTCDDPAVGEGQTCSEFTNAKTCNDVGVVNAIGACTCNGNAETTGIGPYCEFTNAKTCSNAGVVDATGVCTCDDPAVGEGQTCSEFTNAKTCSDAGVVDATGACICYKTAPGIATEPDPDCSRSTEEELLDRERTDYVPFYIASAILVVLIELCGIGYLIHRANAGKSNGWKQYWLVTEFGIRSFDMMSDWAFFVISLRPKLQGGYFAQVYTGDVNVIRYAVLAFCITGLLLWIPDLYAFYIRTAKFDHDDADALRRHRRFTSRITLAVIIFEDAPQLALSSVVLNVLGFGKDPIATTSFSFSILSLALSIWRIYTEGVRDGCVLLPDCNETTPQVQGRAADRVMLNPASARHVHNPSFDLLGVFAYN